MGTKYQHGWGDLHYKMGKIEYSTASTTPNTTTHNNQHEPPPPYPSAALALSLHGQAIWRHQPMAPRLPKVSLKARVVGFGGIMAGLPVWGAKWNHIKNREEHGVSAVGGRHLIGRYNNQIGVGNCGSRDVGEEAPPGCSMWGDVSASIWVAIQTTKKSKNIIHLGLRRPPMDYFPHNNPPKRAGVA